MNAGTFIGGILGAVAGLIFEISLSSSYPGRMVAVGAIAGGFLGYGWWADRI